MSSDKANLLLKLFGLVLAAALAVSLQARERANAGDDDRAMPPVLELQELDGRTGSGAGCKPDDRAAPRQTLCFFDPRQRPVSKPAGNHSLR